MPLPLNVLLISEEQKAAVRACTVSAQAHSWLQPSVCLSKEKQGDWCHCHWCHNPAQNTTTAWSEALLTALSKINYVFMPYSCLHVTMNKHFMVIYIGSKSCVAYFKKSRVTWVDLNLDLDIICNTEGISEWWVFVLKESSIWSKMNSWSSTLPSCGNML